MGETIIVSAVEVAGSSCCVALGDGQKVYNRIFEAFSEDRKVELSFEGAGDLTPAFLNAAVGQLYGSFPEDFIMDHLFFTGLGPDDEIILRRVLERAKCYFVNADYYRKAVRDVLEGEEMKGEEMEGEKTKGKKIGDKETESEETEGEKTETEDKETEGEKTETEDKETEGEETEGEETEGKYE